MRKEGVDGPHSGEDAGDEENENEVRGEGLAEDVAMDKPGQHTQRGDEGEDLRQAPKAEEDGCEPHGGWVVRVMMMRLSATRPGSPPSPLLPTSRSHELCPRGRKCRMQQALGVSCLCFSLCATIPMIFCAVA